MLFVLALADADPASGHGPVLQRRHHRRRPLLRLGVSRQELIAKPRIIHSEPEIAAI